MKAWTILLGVLLVLAAPFAAAQFNNSSSVNSSSSVPVVIRHAELDSTDIFPFGFNQLDLERNDEFTLKLELFSFQRARDVEVRAFVSGYEFNDVRPISAQIGPFDVDPNVTYVKRLTLHFPSDVDRDDYKLRVEVSDRNSFSQFYDYDLQISAPRHGMTIEDVTLNPGNTITAGQSLLTRVRIENKGQRDEKDVKVTMNIPGLNVGASDTIDKIDNDDQEETEEMLLRVPRCAQPGTYDMTLDVWYNKNHDRISGTSKVTVLENPACKEVAPVVTAAPTQPAEPTNTSTDKIRLALEIALGVLIVLLVIVALVGFARMRDE
ncbi:hypothetical protein J4211_02980 [Candidatus Woesearchaeota archaeon]|nr:hypothetical protein [Candidatus Woesearchaeota archaeon]